MSDTCPGCGAEKTNRGTLRLYGPYTGYKCRSWFSDLGKSRRSDECIDNEINQKEPEETSGWDLTITKLVSECRRILAKEKRDKFYGKRLKTFKRERFLEVS